MTTGPQAVTTKEGHAADPTLSSPTLSGDARRAMETRRFERCFLGDWSGLTFLHFEVKASLLGGVVPFRLDLREGRAFVTLVAFTMRRFRPARGGRLTSWFTAPLATQRFLNLRTYVRGPLGPGIFFMREWLDHPLAVPLGPPTFGLPYWRGRISYRQDQTSFSGEVTANGRMGVFRGSANGTPRIAAAGSLDEFLQERYLAYTAAGRRPLAFRVWHEPWLCRDLTLHESTLDSLLRDPDEPWTKSLRFTGATCSDGVSDVWMGRPHRA